MTFELSWCFNEYFIYENKECIIVWSDPDYHGDDSYRKFHKLSNAINFACVSKNTWRRDKGKVELSDEIVESLLWEEKEA